jgi:hypothetical protein
MKQNTFKNNTEPVKIQPAKQKLNPPKFEEELIDFTRKGIFWGQALIKSENKPFPRY